MKYFILTLEVLFAGFFVLVGCMVLFGLIETFRELRTLAQLRCPRCKATYGRATARRSKAQYKSDLADEIRRLRAEVGEYDDIDFFSHEWPVECPRCGHQVYYDASEKKLVPEVEAK